MLCVVILDSELIINEEYQDVRHQLSHLHYKSSSLVRDVWAYIYDMCKEELQKMCPDDETLITYL